MAYMKRAHYTSGGIVKLRDLKREMAQAAMRERYQAAHRKARMNATHGRWLENPVRIEDGYPGLFVRADGQVCHFAGFRSETMFPIGRG